MATKHDTATPTIARKLILFLVLFYLVYYMVSIILVGAFQAGWDQLGRFPFRTSKQEFNPGLTGPALGAWLAMAITYTCAVPLSFWVVAATRRTWDYLATISILHWGISCAVCTQFPVNWIWWITLILATLLVSLVSEVIIYRLKDLKDIELGN